MAIDLLNPLVSLKWKGKEFMGVLPDYSRMRSDTLVYKGYLCVVVTYEVGHTCDEAKSSMCLYDSHSWKMLPPLPCVSPGLSTYHSQLVLVGGEPPNGKSLWLSTDDGNSWSPSLLPEMPRERLYHSVVNPKNPECLIVAGGTGQKYFTANTTMDVLLNEQWWTVPSLPYVEDPSNIKLSIHNGRLYVCGDGSIGSIFHCDLRVLIESITPSDRADSDLWDAAWQCGNYTNNNLNISYQRKMFYFSTTCVTEDYLLSMHVLHNKSVVAIGTSVDGEAPDSFGCTHLLPGKGFSILDCVDSGFVHYTPFVTVSSYDPNGQFNWSALSKLQASGIEVISALQKIKQLEPITSSHEECDHNHGACLVRKRFLKDDHWIAPVEAEDFFEWLSSKVVPQTWQSLYHVLEKLDYGKELSEQIETHLKCKESLKELCTSVIMQALLEKEEELDPDQLSVKLPDYIPPTLKHFIAHRYNSFIYVTL